jgi:hypothetical protein
MFAMAESDQAAFIASHADQQRRDDRFRLCALSCGVAALLAILAVVILLVHWKEPWAAIATAGLGVTGIVAAFVNARIPGRTPPSEQHEGKAKGAGGADA